jgi:signal transduction histidine kinase/ActR/RegA family two-component response regulator/HPt (histidine-containing phosphotransfer) domain-containing protein
MWTRAIPPAARERGRLLVRALLYWSAAAVPLVVLLGVHRRGEEAARRRADAAEHDARAALVQHVVEGDLAVARADLRMFGTIGAVQDYVDDPVPGRKAALARDLSAFVASRPWCRGVAVQSAGDRRAGEEAGSLCDATSARAAALERGRTVLETAPAPGGAHGASPLLCLAESLGPGAGGRGWALAAEIEARVLFADLAAVGGQGAFLRDAAGRWLVPPPAGASLAAGTLTLPTWADASSPWRASVAEAHAGTEDAEAGRREPTLASVLLALSGCFAFLLARSADGRRRAERQASTQLALLETTEREAAEREARRSLEALRQARKAAEAGTRAKSEFLAVMSHEMRTPLNAVLGATGLLLDGPLAREQRELAGMARTAGRALLDLIDDLLDFSRIEAGRLDLERVAFDPRRLLLDTVAPVAAEAEAKGLELAAEVDPDVPGRLCGDPGRVRQVLRNLLGNAVKFTEKGRVTALFELAEKSESEVVLRLRVRDTGPGIPPAYLPHLFQPFTQAESATTRRHGGTGLGLAVVRRLVELMGGTVEVSSTPGEGSEFTCTVRLAEAAPEDEAAVPAPGPEPAPRVRRDRPLRVLLAEDNLVNQRVTRAQLQRLGCDVDVVGGGREAIAAVSRRRYDVVLMDCQMPDVDGYDATREIRAREGGAPGVPIVALTANALRGDRERCLAAGMDDYLAKPADLASLREALDRHARAARTESKTIAAAGRHLPLVDSDALSSLRALERDGPGFLAEVVREFDEGFRQKLGDMQLAARENDGAALRGAAHFVKGSAGIVGAEGMASLCRRLERLGAEDKAKEAAGLVASLAHEHEAVMSVLREAVESLPGRRCGEARRLECGT